MALAQLISLVSELEQFSELNQVGVELDAGANLHVYARESDSERN